MYASVNYRHVIQGLYLIVWLLQNFSDAELFDFDVCLMNAYSVSMFIDQVENLRIQ